MRYHASASVFAMHELLKNIAEPLQITASAKSVFGDPIEAQGRTIIPVARVAYGFGGGSGQGQREGRSGEGGGGGGGVVALPLGIIEVAPGGTRFIPLRRERKALTAAVIGLAIGWLVAGKLLGRQIGKRT